MFKSDENLALVESMVQSTTIDGNDNYFGTSDGYIYALFNSNNEFSSNRT